MAGSEIQYVCYLRLALLLLTSQLYWVLEMDGFLRMKKDVGLALASDALHAGYNFDEVYADAKAVDAGIVEYDSDDNPIVLDKKNNEPIPSWDHSQIDYEPFGMDFYEEKPSI